MLVHGKEKVRMIAKIRAWIKDNGYEGVIISRRDNYTWITQGDENHVLTNTEMGITFLLITIDTIQLYADCSDVRRMQEEQNSIGAQVIEVPWYESIEKVLQQAILDRSIVSDSGVLKTKNVQEQLVELRLSLNECQIERYRKVGKSCAEVVECVCMDAKLGQTENEIAYWVKEGCLRQGISPDCILVGSDERIIKYRHPMPTDKKIEKSLIVVLGGAKYGLNISLTRMVSFEALSLEVTEKYRKIQIIFATMQLMMRDKMSSRVYFEKLQEIYQQLGYEDEWKKHHQGGPTGYACRELIITPNSEWVLSAGQAYAWNPSITGVKCEDTTYLSAQGVENFTQTAKWPRKRVVSAYGTMDVAEILVKQ